MFSFPIERADAQNTDIISDDAALICLQYATQWDWFAHVGAWFDADDAGGDRLVREGRTKVKRVS